MIKNRFRKYVCAALVILGAGSATGCVDPSSITFLAGYLLGRTTAPTTTSETCFLNGEAVDCSTLAQ